MPNKHDHVTGRPRDYISRKWWYRGRHRNGAFTVGKLCSEVAYSLELINIEKLEEAQRRACAEAKGSWHTTPDGKYYCFHGMVHVPNEFGEDPRIMIRAPEGLTSIPALPCPHENQEYNAVTEKYWSNGMFGIPASNIPLYTDIVDETVHCLDCGEQLLPIPMLYDRKQGWHNNE